MQHQKMGVGRGIGVKDREMNLCLIDENRFGFRFSSECFSYLLMTMSMSDII